MHENLKKIVRTGSSNLLTKNRKYHFKLLYSPLLIWLPLIYHHPWCARFFGIFQKLYIKNDPYVGAGAVLVRRIFDFPGAGAVPVQRKLDFAGAGAV